MFNKTYICIFLGLLMQIVLSAEEYLLGEFHFTSREDVASNELHPLLKFETPIIYEEYESNYLNGIVNISLKNGSSMTLPLARLSIFPKEDFDVRVSRIELVLIVESEMASPVSFAHNNKGSDWQTAKSINTTRSLTHGIASCQIGYELLIQDTIDCPVETGYHLFISTSDIQSISNGKVLGIDYVRFYGPYTDNRVSSIIVPEDEQFLGATVSSAPIEIIIDIDYENLKDELVLTCASKAFSASFLTIDEGEEDLKKIHIIYTPSKTASYETADVVLTAGTSVSVIKVKGWGLPENTLVAWNFDDLTTNPTYQFGDDPPVIGLVGNTEAVYFDKATIADNRWMYEINNLYTTEGSVEKPEKTGLKIIGLEKNATYRLRMDVQWRNTSPNTARIGAYDEQKNSWENNFYWKNPRETLGIFRFDEELHLNSNALYILSAFDQDVQPKAFRPIKPGSSISNTNGWAFDNIIITKIVGSTNNRELKNNPYKIYPYNGYVVLENISSKTKVEIFSADGTLVKQKDIFQNEQIPLNSKGVFIIRLSGTNLSYVQKITI